MFSDVVVLAAGYSVFVSAVSAGLSFFRRFEQERVWFSGGQTLLPVSIFFITGELTNFYQCQFYQQPFVFTDSIIQVAVVAYFQRRKNKFGFTVSSLLPVSFGNFGAHFQQLYCHRIFAYKYIAQVRTQSGNKMMCIKPIIQYFVENEQRLANMLPLVAPHRKVMIR